MVHTTLGRTLSVTTAGEHRLICVFFFKHRSVFYDLEETVLWDIWGQRLPYRKDGAIGIGVSFLFILEDDLEPVQKSRALGLLLSFCT